MLLVHIALSYRFFKNSKLHPYFFPCLALDLQEKQTWELVLKMLLRFMYSNLLLLSKNMRLSHMYKYALLLLIPSKLDDLMYLY